MELIVESGVQLLTRLYSKHFLTGLDNVLFPDGPISKATIEVCGDVSTGKTFLLTQLLAKCILPEEYENLPLKGLNAHAVLINTDCHFEVSKLVDLMLAQIQDACIENNRKVLDDRTMTSIVFSCLDNLHIIKCYNSEQFLLTLHTLDEIILGHKNVALLAIDSILSYYWQDRENGGPQSMDFYIKNLLQIIQKHAFAINIITIYTRPTSDFRANRKEKCIDKPVIRRLNYRIELHRIDKTTEFFATITSAAGVKRVNYIINNDGLKWYSKDKQ